jgi:glycerol kinase
VAAIGITNQRETTVVWNRESGKPVYNAIVWQDRRGAPLCKKLAEDGAEETIREKTGLLIDPYFSATKIAWILENVQGARAEAEAGKLAFGTVDSWLVWNLTSGKRHITDRTNASRTMLYNIVEDTWDADLLKLLNIPQSMLPEVVWSSEPMGEVTTSLGLGEVQIAGIAGDQQSALFGQLCVSPGDAKNTYGTGCFLLQNIGNKFTLSRERLITTLTCSIHKKLEYALEGSIFVGGAVVQWLRDNMRFFSSSPDVESVAATVEDTGGVVFVPAFTGLGAPHWDPYASGMIIGIQRSTQIGHIARAAIESIAFQVTDVLRAMDIDTRQPFRELRVDGGAAANDLLMQFQADLLQLPVRRPAVLETTALGAAYLAGLAVNFWSSTEEIAKLRQEDTLFQPKADKKKMQMRLAKWQDAVQRTRGWNKDYAEDETKDKQ